MLQLEEKSAQAESSARVVSEWSGPAREQAVQRMFTAIARRYDLNNTLLSFGLHHRWKRVAIEYLTTPLAGACGVRSGEVLAEPRYVLDVGTGTADLALLLAPRMGAGGRVLATDLNDAMLREGRRKVVALGHADDVACLRTNAEHLSFSDHAFHAVTAGFCIRNVGSLMTAFAEIRRVLKPGGRFVCLEFSRPVYGWLRTLYDWYSFRLLPWIGAVVARDKTGVYEYLPASIRTFPNQEGLKAMLLKAGFSQADYRNLSGGIVAIHIATK